MGELKLPNGVFTEKLVEGLCSQEQTISIVCRNTGLKFVTKFLKKIDLHKQVFWLQYPKGQELYNLEKLLYRDGEMLSTVKIAGGVWGVNFSFVRLDEHGIQCKMPSDMYEINRRQSHRQKLPKDNTVEFKIFLADYTRMLSTEIVDISTGGLSFLAPVGAKSILTYERKFRNCPLRLGSLNFSCDVRLKNMFFDQGRVKVGVAFENVNPQMIAEIQALINRLKVK